MSDTKRTELPELRVRMNYFGEGHHIVSALGVALTMEQGQEALRRINAYPADREAIRVLKKALEDLREESVAASGLLHDHFGYPATSLRDANIEAEKALKLASALGVGE